MFKTLNGLLNAAINTAMLPIEIVRDIPDAMDGCHRYQSHTSKRLERIGENIDEVGK